MPKAERIDFQFLKAEADFLRILAYYNLEVLGQGVQRQALCPFHADKRPSLKVNLGRKVFQCFGCGAKGNVLEFVRLKEGLSETELRATARKLAEICSLPLTSPLGDRAIALKPNGETRSGSETIEDRLDRNRRSTRLLAPLARGRLRTRPLTLLLSSALRPSSTASIRTLVAEASRPSSSPPSALASTAAKAS